MERKFKTRNKKDVFICAKRQQVIHPNHYFPQNIASLEFETHHFATSHSRKYGNTKNF
jgi:hypothetical protein